MFNPTDAKQDRVIKGRTGFLGQHAMDEGLPPEIEQGNVEYKLKLVNISPDRLEHLITQMKWRISEGGGEALYEIGIADDGQLVGLSEEDLNESFATLTKMAAKLSADCSIVRKRAVTPSPVLTDSGSVVASPSSPNDPTARSTTSTTAAGSRMVAEVLVRKRVEEEHFLEIKVAIVGGSDSGKSTLLGVLTHSEPDNGFGKARSRAFNHKHELETGRTSSLAHELIGFDSEGKLVNFANPSVVTSHHIVERSSKIIALSDIPGHRQFMHTAVAGISALHPHYALVMVNANQPVEVTKEHLGLLLVLRIPFLIVVSKIDVTPPESIKNTLQALLAVIKGPGARLVPCMMKNEDDMVATMPHFGSGGVVPIFLLSSVTGANVDLLVKFLNLLQVPPAPNAEDLAHKDVRFQIRDIYDVPSVGTIVGGQLLSGTLVCSNTRHPTLLLGPFEDGEYRKVQVHSIHRFCRPVRYVKPGQSATLAIKYVEPAPHVLPHHLMVEGVAAPVAGMPVTDSPSRRRGTMATSAASAIGAIGAESARGGIPIPGARRASPANSATTLLSVSPPERSAASADSSPLPLRPRKVTIARTSTPTATPTIHSNESSASPPPSPYRQSHAHKHQPPDPTTPTDPLTVVAADLRRGMVLVSTPSDATAAWTFDVQLHMLYHASELTPGQTAVVYCGSVRQAARVVWVERDLRVRTGDQAKVRFQFLNVPEWMQLGATMLAREGRAGKMKCMGRILAVGGGADTDAEHQGGVEDPVGRAMRKRAGSAPPGVMVGRSLSPDKAGGNR
ncbi:P-loop containing nucleoside triphosphate hydrolase protein [Catenaria anguillulae PL171]|uniref:p-loop containing nucleoside triphosphate hydrolase protein n=1 Tax=Catenaria anguillulae PL171 TaxID=765915 RepID=A0A1Y2HQP3_9FUNG|nr:P-loop containing nucleoside triphosphate hydrolase protein [Catenaria anguillulae PL171]